MKFNLFDNTHYSVTIYQHKETKDLIISPQGFNKHGIRCQILDVVYVVKYPYDEETVGKIIKTCMGIVIKKDYTEDNMIVKKGEKWRGPQTTAKEKSVKKFNENHYLQVVFFHKKEGYEFEVWHKDKHSKWYTGDSKYVIKKPKKISEQGLGETIIEVFEHCG